MMPLCLMSLESSGKSVTSLAGITSGSLLVAFGDCAPATALNATVAWNSFVTVAVAHV